MRSPVRPHLTRVTEGVGVEPICHMEFNHTKTKNSQEGKTIPRNRRNGENCRRNGSDLVATPSVTRVGVGL